MSGQNVIATKHIMWNILIKKDRKKLIKQYNMSLRKVHHLLQFIDISKASDDVYQNM